MNNSKIPNFQAEIDKCTSIEQALNLFRSSLISTKFYKIDKVQQRLYLLEQSLAIENSKLVLIVEEPTYKTPGRDTDSLR
jgi:hypothetical protein